MTPVVKLLRLMDGQKPAMGNIYDRMFIIGQKISESSVSWKDQAAKIHATPHTLGVVEKWDDTDSDSEESDEEDLKM